MTTTGRGLAVAGQKLIYTPKGTHAYAFSGSVSYNDTETSALEFTNGPEPLKCYLHIEYVGTSGDDLTAKIYLNNVQVWETYMSAGTTIQREFPVKFIVPETTTLKLTFTNQDGTMQIGYAILKAQVLEL